ncbi:hypothetical protein VFPPC_15868 [Pochonia chlamydosporia 170]|uniref:Uncharacterized protein n=1 Tax=Pochonia chlamydosporia 170 TaxID=1380566 RepID=A0A179FSZ1_METCM|nr:hypothetical protein VFPPC_15868 [Pochonia chlamydosporia 170]OAQ68732.2 hypothetical protein VFPPC_15868 [Pochonia chlamydosporia 170]
MVALICGAGLEAKDQRSKDGPHLTLPSATIHERFQLPCPLLTQFITNIRVYFLDPDQPHRHETNSGSQSPTWTRLLDTIIRGLGASTTSLLGHGVAIGRKRAWRDPVIS